MWKWFRWVLLGVGVIAVLIISSTLYVYLQKNADNTPKQGISEFKETVIDDQISEDIETKYYDISGSTKEDLKSQMGSLGPECGEENRCHAYTSWVIDWTYPTQKDNSCEPVSVEVSIEYTYPRWIDKFQASPSLQNEWDVYLSKLTAHEENHKKIAVENAQKFLIKLNGINQTDYRSCKELEDNISAYWSTGEIINACTLETKSYDEDTNHGVSEGVVL